MGYAFISYSTQNKNSAETIKNIFNKHNIETWMAPYDIPVGSKYAHVINKALKDCSCLVLLLTNASQNSTWVAKELERAINYKKVIITIQLEELVLNDEFEFYISNDQFVFSRNLDEDSDEIKRVLASVSACIAQNSEEHVKWYTLSNENNDKIAQYNLALCYLNGTGVSKNSILAFDLFCKSARQGFADAQYCLGFCYEFGKGVAVEPSRALFWYEKAAQQGNSWAQHRLGECYYYGRGTSQDPQKAFYWLKCAADQKNDGAYPLLAQCYETGFGVEQDKELAHYWRNKQS